MKTLLFQVLPILFGLLVGWCIVQPPDFLGSSVLIRTAAVISLAILALFFFLMYVISANLPAHIKLQPIDQRAVSDEMTDLFSGYQDIGFRLVGSPLRVEVNPPAVLVPMVHEQEPMYGTVYRTTTSPPKTSYDIVSIFEPFGGLTTGAAPEGASLPAGLGSFMQIFPDADINTLTQQHQAAIKFLLKQGVRIKPVTDDSFAGDFRAAIAAQRRHFFSNPIAHTAITVWRSMTGKTPHIGPLEEQSVAQRNLRRFLKTG